MDEDLIFYGNLNVNNFLQSQGSKIASIMFIFGVEKQASKIMNIIEDLQQIVQNQTTNQNRENKSLDIKRQLQILTSVIGATETKDVIRV